ncbi:MAG: DUF934 domain-containing protein [Alphaproteobacteria bacterium]|nr:DUF934 domain-containing protein [Alphaproteobacteria bacterium]
MQIIRLIAGQPVTDIDVWARIGDDDPLPESAPALVSLARWQSAGAGLARRNVAVGVWLASDEVLDGLISDLERLDLIALDFPNLNDGRHFTTARLLRERHGFRGEIRATGQVLRDQLFAMARCGFDSFELQAHQDTAAAHEAFSEISVVFQPAADGRAAAQAIRAGGAGAHASAS